MIDEKKLIEHLKEIANEHPYKIQGNPDSYSDYSQGWADCADRMISIVENMLQLATFGEWIPVSERLPQADEGEHGFVSCNVTIMRNHWPTSSYDVCDSPYDEYFVVNAIYDTSQKIWHLNDSCQLNALLDIEDSPLNGDYVIAWMPLPEAYMGE